MNDELIARLREFGNDWGNLGNPNVMLRQCGNEGANLTEEAADALEFLESYRQSNLKATVAMVEYVPAFGRLEDAVRQLGSRAEAAESKVQAMQARIAELEHIPPKIENADLQSLLTELLDSAEDAYDADYPKVARTMEAAVRAIKNLQMSVGQQERFKYAANSRADAMQAELEAARKERDEYSNGFRALKLSARMQLGAAEDLIGRAHSSIDDWCTQADHMPDEDAELLRDLNAWLSLRQGWDRALASPEKT